MNVGFFPRMQGIFMWLRNRVWWMTFCCLLPANVDAHRAWQDPVFDVQLNNATVPAGIQLLGEKTGCVINYATALFDKTTPVNLDLKRGTLSQALTRLLAGTRVTFHFIDAHTVTLYRQPDPVKPGKLAGRVRDEKGTPLPGASVKVLQAARGTQTTVDGSYLLELDPGTYTVEVSYISFQTRRITGVTIKSGGLTPLDISLPPNTKGLQEVVVTAGYNKASADALLVQQKNAAEISNGISAEQLARTPDRNIGESLKRIAGVSSIDNKFVLVRGIGERYNTAQLDGVILPSTEAQSRNFSFDMIPSNLVDNIIVSKTVTPDMNASFGGGLIQVVTKDMPTQNFASFTAGLSFNDQSTGKDFLSHKHGQYDFLGFDDGRRDFPAGLVHTDRGTAPNIELTDEAYAKLVTDQSRKFTNDNLTVYRYKTQPSQNYQFSLGRLLTLDTSRQRKLGFTGSISYRNTQNINDIAGMYRSDWNLNAPDNVGNAYNYNTTLGALLNTGLQMGRSRFSLRNTYTHTYDNSMVRITGFSRDEADFRKAPNRRQEVDDPTFTTLLQNKLNGLHQLGSLKLEWNLARTGIQRQEKDLVMASSYPEKIGNEYHYFYGFNYPPQVQLLPTSRHHYENRERHYSWDVAATLPLLNGPVRSNLKAGYFGSQKKAAFNWEIAALSANPAMSDSGRYLPVGEMINPANLGYDKFFYAVSAFFLDGYEGKSQTHAGFLMFDTRIREKLRLVWGVRGEYYQYTEIKNGKNQSAGNDFVLKADKHWQWLPSASLTYSPTQTINLRTAFSSSVVRPELLDNSRFFRYSPYLGGQFGNQGIYSTRINSYDVKAEWFPGPGETIAVNGFYKYFDKPAELTLIQATDFYTYYLRSADYAKVYGLEFELRKNLDFAHNSDLLKRFIVFGNYTLQRSEVQSIYKATNPSGGPDLVIPTKQHRAMYGQSPYLYNLGLQYQGKHIGFNSAFNKSGYKTYIVSDNPVNIEYERPRGQLDLQLSYRLLKNKMEIKINGGNLTNSASTYYRNTASYEPNPDYSGPDKSQSMRLKAGYSNRYERGDLITFSQKFGRTYSAAVTYNF